MAFSLELLVRQFRMLAFISQRKHNGTETLVRYNVGVLSRFDLTEKVDQVNRVGDLNTVTLRHFLPHMNQRSSSFRRGRKSSVKWLGKSLQESPQPAKSLKALSSVTRTSEYAIPKMSRKKTEAVSSKARI